MYVIKKRGNRIIDIYEKLYFKKLSIALICSKSNECKRKHYKKKIDITSDVK